MEIELNWSEPTDLSFSEVIYASNANVPRTFIAVVTGIETCRAILTSATLAFRVHLFYI